MNYYEILQISPEASDMVIKAAYKALVKQFHPDNGMVGDEEKLKLLNEAYSILSNIDSKRAYDESLKKKDESNTECDNNDRTFEQNIYNNTEYDEPSGIFSSFVRGVSNEIQRNKQIEENAYYDGLKLCDYDLVHIYRNNYGLKRMGYARVLEERGLLRRTGDGRFVPTEEFKYYW